MVHRGHFAPERLQGRPPASDAPRMNSGVSAARVSVPSPRTQPYGRCAAARTVAEACEGIADDLREAYDPRSGLVTLEPRSA